MSNPVETNDSNALADLLNGVAPSRSEGRAASIRRPSEEAEIQDGVETANSNRQPPDAGKSLFKSLRECCPKGSDSVLERIIHDRDHDPGPRLMLFSDGRSWELSNPREVWAHIDRLKPSEHSILVIEDINDEWCEALCSRYPSSINRTFLVEHIIGIMQTTIEYVIRVMPATKRMAQRLREQFDNELAEKLLADLERIDQAMLLPHDRESVPGYHIDCWQETERSGPREISLGCCQLRKVPSGWIKTNGLLSYCQLQANFYLVLTPSFPSWRKDDPRPEGDRTLYMNPEAERANPQHVKWHSPDMFSTVLSIFRGHWPFFTWNDTETGHTSPVQKHVDGALLMAWILTTELSSNIESAETLMRSLLYSIIGDDQDHFTQLVRFRRDLGRRHDDLKRAHKFVVGYLSIRPSTKSSFNKGGFLRERLPGREILERPLLDCHAGLEKRLDAIEEDLNEEIQVTVGTVQVRDAQLMKEQARVTARQTTWTVALTVLAAVYLPMTLVTGIFGMNITEISSEANAPNAWWAVGAWVVIVVLTVTGILVYVVVQKLRSRKKKSDLEASDKNVKGITNEKQDACGTFGEGATKWVRSARQKMGAAWSRKRE